MIEATPEMVEGVVGEEVLSHKKLSAPETASVQEEHQPTVVSSTDGANLPRREEVIYKSNEITPEQSSLLERPNYAQYPTEQELSGNKDITNEDKSQEDEEIGRLKAKYKSLTNRELRGLMKRGDSLIATFHGEENLPEDIVNQLESLRKEQKAIQEFLKDRDKGRRSDRDYSRDGGRCGGGRSVIP